jgi:ribosomal protein S18 acetylase RimI-like enzyme
MVSVLGREFALEGGPMPRPEAPSGNLDKPDARREFRIAAPQDLDALLWLMEQMPVSIHGVRGRVVSRALCHDAVRQRDCFVVLALEGAEPIGYAVLVTCWSGFKFGFLRRHPLVALRILLKPRRPQSALVSDRSGGASDSVHSSIGFCAGEQPRWDDDAPWIAKLYYVSVSPERRRTGIGSGLTQAYERHLRTIGIVRVDARIAAANTASVELHRSSGWEIFDQNTHVLAVRWIPERDPVGETGRLGGER